MKLYTNIDDFFRDNEENFKSSLKFLSDIFETNIVINIYKEEAIPQHFFLFSPDVKFGGKCIDFDYFYPIHKQTAAEQLTDSITSLYEKTFDKPLNLNSTQLVELEKTINFLSEADSQIAGCDIPVEVEQYELDTKGVRIALFNAAKSVLKKTNLKP